MALQGVYLPLLHLFVSKPCSQVELFLWMTSFDVSRRRWASYALTASCAPKTQNNRLTGFRCLFALRVLSCFLWRLSPCSKCLGTKNVLSLMWINRLLRIVVVRCKLNLQAATWFLCYIPTSITFNALSECLLVWFQLFNRPHVSEHRN